MADFDLDLQYHPGRMLCMMCWAESLPIWCWLSRGSCG